MACHRDGETERQREGGTERERDGETEGQRDGVAFSLRLSAPPPLRLSVSPSLCLSFSPSLCSSLSLWLVRRVRSRNRRYLRRKRCQLPLSTRRCPTAPLRAGSARSSARRPAWSGN